MYKDHKVDQECRWPCLCQEIMGWKWHQLDHMLIICTSF